ncbi:carboxylesterase family protein [Streptomyces sp. NPDC054787]
MNRRPGVLLGAALVLAALLGSALPATASPSGGSPRPVVTVAQGALRGQSRDGAQEFLGIPYAAAPVGEARLRAPGPPPRWHGTREASRQAPACLQFSPFGLSDPGPSARTVCTWTCTGPAAPAQEPGSR